MKYPYISNVTHLIIERPRERKGLLHVAVHDVVQAVQHRRGRVHFASTLSLTNQKYDHKVKII